MIRVALMASLAAACLAGCGKQPEAVPATAPKAHGPGRHGAHHRAGRRRMAVLRPHLRRAALQPARRASTRATSAQLGLAWSYDLDTAHRVQEATPLVIDGVMYVTSAWSKLFALDARTGKEIWALRSEGAGRSGRQGLLRRGAIAASRRGTARSTSARSTVGWSRSTRPPASRCGRS